MDHRVLVDIDVRTGSEIVRALLDSGMKLNVALWATFSNYADPRLVLASSDFDEENPKPISGQVRAATEGKVSPYRIPPMLAMSVSDPFIKDLRHTYGSIADSEGMRLGSASFGGRYLEDGYVYFIH